MSPRFSLTLTSFFFADGYSQLSRTMIMGYKKELGKQSEKLSGDVPKAGWCAVFGFFTSLLIIMYACSLPRPPLPLVNAWLLLYAVRCSRGDHCTHTWHDRHDWIIRIFVSLPFLFDHTRFNYVVVHQGDALHAVLGLIAIVVIQCYLPSPNSIAVASERTSFATGLPRAFGLLSAWLPSFPLDDRTLLLVLWWDHRSEFASLHKMNPHRMRFIREKVLEVLQVHPDTTSSATSTPIPPTIDSSHVLESMDVLDIRCSGGILSKVRSSRHL